MSAEPWRPTIGSWRNERIRGKHRASDGTYPEHCIKKIVRLSGRSFLDYPYGSSDEPQNPGEQYALICAPQTGTVAIDVDDEQAYEAAGIPFGRADAMTVRGQGFHVWLDYRGIPAELWPVQGPIHGGDIKSKGFVPLPGCEHYTGEKYARAAGEPGQYRLHLVTIAEARAIKAARDGYERKACGAGGTGGTGGGKDGRLAGKVYGWVFAGADKDECYRRWVVAKTEIGENPAWPWEYEDFDRHHRGAWRKYLLKLEEDAKIMMHAGPARQTAGGFWDARPELAYVHALAKARRCSPDAVLGTVLLRVIMSIPPTVVLPPLIGGAASLNLFVGLTGPSGTGKGSALKLAREVVPDLPEPAGFHTVGLGSGEGLQHQYIYWDKDTKEYVRVRSAVLFTAEEAETVSALKTRTASTLLPELRKAAMGEDLGFAYADKAKALRLPPHTYRLGVMLGIQPSSAGWLLDDHGTGTPQRFLFAAAPDPGAPDVAPPEPPPWQWHWDGLLPEGDSGGGLRVLPVCESVRRDVNASYLARSRGEETDPLAGHALLMREKVAAALAYFAYPQRAEISEDDWQLAGVIMQMSARALGDLRGAMADETREQIRLSGTAEGTKRDVASEARHQHAIERIARNLLSKIESEPLPKADLRRMIARRDRDYLEDAITQLTDDGSAKWEDSRLRKII